jgi:hypothetical protein
MQEVHGWKNAIGPEQNTSSLAEIAQVARQFTLLARERSRRRE